MTIAEDAKGDEEWDQSNRERNTHMDAAISAANKQIQRLKSRDKIAKFLKWKEFRKIINKRIHNTRLLKEIARSQSGGFEESKGDSEPQAGELESNNSQKRKAEEDEEIENKDVPIPESLVATPDADGKKYYEILPNLVFTGPVGSPPGLRTYSN